MKSLGIDPGLNGGLCLVRMIPDKGYEILEMDKMPRDEKFIDLISLTKTISDWHKTHEIDICVLEKATARPGQGVVSMFKFGRVYGAIEGVLASLGVEYKLVHPATWCKVMHEFENKSAPSKTKSLNAALRHFSGVDFRATPRSKKAHDGIVDAALMGIYGVKSTF